MLTRRRFAALAIAQSLLLTGAGAALFPRPSLGETPQMSPPRVEILVLYAKADPRGGHMGHGVPNLPELTQAPFNAYNAFEVVGRTTLTLGQPKAGEPWQGKPSGVYALPNGKPIEIALIKQRPDGRFHMGAALGKESPDVVRWNAPAGDPVFIAGQQYKDGILVIGITLRVGMPDAGGTY